MLAALGVLAYHSRHRIHLADFTWHRFIQAVGQANIWLLLAALVGIYVCYAIRSLRWQRLSRYLGPTSFGAVFSGTMMGFASIFILGRPGEPVRPLLLAKKCRLPVAGMFGIWVFERLLDFAAAIGLATLAVLVFSEQLGYAGVTDDWEDRAQTLAWLLLVVLAIVIGLMVYFRLRGASAIQPRLVQWRAAGGAKGWLASIVGGFSEGLQAIRTATDLILALFYTALYWGLAALIFLWICQAFGGELNTMNFAGAMLLLAFTLVGATLQLPAVGGGAQAASIGALTLIFGVDQEPAVVVALVLWAITFVSPILAGIPLLIHEGLSMAELRKLVRAEEEAEESGAHISLSLFQRDAKKPDASGGAAR